jgi:Protein of unknown function (DUF4240)
MTTILEIPLRQITLANIQDLQDKYPDATLRIETDNLSEQSMSESIFWSIIDLFDWRTRDANAIMAPAIKALSEYEIADIYQLHDILNEKLFALDGEKYARELGDNRYSEETYFSADNFLYSRCCVVANGPQFYHAVLEDPSKMPKNFTFESLLYLPLEAFKLKTGSADYNHYPEIWAETFSNKQGWPGAKLLLDSVLDLS